MLRHSKISYTLSSYELDMISAFIGLLIRHSNGHTKHDLTTVMGEMDDKWSCMSDKSMQLEDLGMFGG